MSVDRDYAANGLNQYTLSGSTSLGYDARGNLTSSGTSTYGYDALNRLSTTNGSVSYLEYGALDELQGYNLTTGVYPRFASDGVKIAAEYLQGSPSTPQRRYVYGAEGDEAPLVWYEGSGTTDRRWLVTDERGSVVAVTNASGSATAINSYDEYGIPASGNTGTFQYTGQAWLAPLGLSYYKNRMYSPTLGRFMQTDPIGYGDGPNWYNYVGSDPVNFTDPLGLVKKPEPQTPCLADTNCEDHQPEIVVTAPKFRVVKREVPWDYRGIYKYEQYIVPGPGVYLLPNRVKLILTKQEKPAPPPTWASRAEDILCSDTTGNIADAVAGAITGAATSAAIRGANWAYAASLGGRIGSIVGRRALLIAGGPEFAIAVGVGYITSRVVAHERSAYCPAVMQ